MIDLSGILIQVAGACLAVLTVAMLLVFVRLRKGPYLSDRVLALDLMTTIVMGIFGAYSIYSRQEVYVDVTVLIALIAFISTVIYAKFIEKDVSRNNLKGDRQ